MAPGETLSEFVERSVREAVMRRSNHAEFIARGMRSLEDARRIGVHVDADAVIAKLEGKLAAAQPGRPAKVAAKR